MSASDNRTLYFILSLVITFLVHLALWQLSTHWTVTPFGQLVGNEPQQNRTMTIDSLDMTALIEPPKLTKKVDVKDRLMEEHRRHLTTIFDQQAETKLPKIEQKPIPARLGQVEQDVAALRPAKLALGAPPPKILQIDADTVPLERLLSKRRTIPKVKRYDLRGNVAPVLSTAIPGGGAPAMFTAKLGALKLPAPPRLKADLPTPKANLRLVHERVPAVQLESYEDTHILDSMLEADFESYTDPDTGEVFYSFKIRTNEESDEVPQIPRDVLFLLDASASISDAALKQYRQGVLLALDYLHPDDAFNIVVFRANARALFPDFVAPTQENILRAKRYVHGQATSGRTDVYRSLAPFVDHAPRSQRPFMIFLITDGKSTTKSKLENDELIRRVIAENRAEASIFSFSAGERDRNRFLLNFLSYKNRGLTLHEDSLERAQNTFVRYFGSLSEVLVADLHYDLSSGLGEEAYPRDLHHLFRSQPLVVYGRAEPQHDLIDLRVVGRNRNGAREELIVRKRLSEATPAGPALALRWAAQKIYHLIAERSLGTNPDADADITRLATKYNIDVPYIHE